MSSRAPELLAISSGILDSEEAVGSWCAAVAAAGVGAIQLREKRLSDRRLEAFASAAVRAVPAGSTLLVNARADLARAVGASGVHLPANGVPTSGIRRLLGPEVCIGRSTHQTDEVEEAFAEGADYVTFGPVFSTPSKERYGPPVGLEALARAVEIGGPVLALGGITMENVVLCLRAGAHGIAGISLFRSDDDLEVRIRRLRKLLEDEPD